MLTCNTFLTDPDKEPIRKKYFPLPPGSGSVIFLTDPDPWPKKINGSGRIRNTAYKHQIRFAVQSRCGRARQELDCDKDADPPSLEDKLKKENVEAEAELAASLDKKFRSVLAKKLWFGSRIHSMIWKMEKSYVL